APVAAAARLVHPGGHLARRVLPAGARAALPQGSGLTGPGTREGAVGWTARATRWKAVAAARWARAARLARAPRLAATAPILLLLALPLVMLAAGPAWAFPRPDTVDPWMYVGFCLQPAHHLDQFGRTYHGTRLPVLLPG